MIKLVFKYVIPLVVLLTVALVGYNYFWGTDDERQKSKQIIEKFKDLGSEVVNLLHSETEKYDSGKYDDALDKIGSRIADLKSKASSVADGGSQLLNQLDDLEQQKTAMESQLAELKSAQDSANRSKSSGNSGLGQPVPPENSELIAQIGAQIEKLATETQELSSRIEQ